MMNILIYDDNLKDIEHLLFCLNGLFQKNKPRLSNSYMQK